MRPHALAVLAGRADARADAINWERLAAEFVVAYDATNSIPEALKRVFKVARFAPSRGSSAAAEAVLGEVAAQHGITVDALMFGKGAAIVAARDDAFARLWDDSKGMAFAAIGRLFRMHHTSVLAGVARHRARVGSRGLEAVKAAA